MLQIVTSIHKIYLYGGFGLVKPGPENTLKGRELMKTIMIGAMALVSLNAMARTNPNGAGMYCALDAEAQAKLHAKANGASKAELNSAVTVSLDPEQGILYKTTIGAQRFYIVETAKDGICVTEYVKEL